MTEVRNPSACTNLKISAERAKSTKSYGELPKDWDSLSTIGNVIPGTRFICFKTPFNALRSYPKNLKHKIFTTDHLIKEMEKKGIKLALVVDLTDSTRYYDPSDLESKQVKVLKIRIPGAQVPRSEDYERFAREVSECLETTPEELKVGIHCTHGINRTGWFVCRYLMDHLNYTADEAIKSFSQARGYEMQRPYLIKDLRDYCAQKSCTSPPTKSSSANEILLDHFIQSSNSMFSGSKKGSNRNTSEVDHSAN